MKYNKKRQESFKNKNKSQLTEIAKSGSLGSACARFFLWERFKEVVPYNAESILVAKKAEV